MASFIINPYASGGAPPPTPDYYQKLLLHMNGTNGSTTFTDSSYIGRSVTANGNAQISTAQSKFGGAGGLFDGNGDYLSVPDSADWYFGTGDFTIDLWVRPESLGSYNMIIEHSSGNSNDRWFFYCRDVSGSKYVTFSATVGGSYIINSLTSGTALTASSWAHIAIVRSGTTFTIYQGGNSVASIADISAALGDYTSDLRVGAQFDSNIGWNGYMDELRISKGIARWTSNFTPPTSEYST